MQSKRDMSKQNNEIENSEPRLVKSHDVKLDVEYAEWIAEVKHRYRSTQVKANSTGVSNGVSNGVSVHVTGTEVSDILMIGVARWQMSIILLTLRLSLILSSITSVIMKQLSPSALNVVTGMSMISIPQMMVRMTRLISAVSYRNMTPKTVDIKKNRNY